MKHAYVVLCVTLFACFCVFAQTPQPEPKEKAKTGAKANKAKKSAKTPASQKAKPGAGTKGVKRKAGEKGAKPESESEGAKPAPPPEEPRGDVITFTSGARLKGVQVVKRSASDVEVDVGGGVSLTIPRKQIKDIQFDKIEPTSVRPAAGAPGQKEAEVIPGNKLKPEVSDKLTSPLPEPIKQEKADLITIVSNLSERLGITIVVDDPVKNLPAKDRVWAFETKPGQNLMELLQEDLLKQFKNLAVVFQFDKLLLTTKEKASEMAAKEAPQGQQPPAAGAAAAPGAAPAAPAAPGAAPAAPAVPGAAPVAQPPATASPPAAPAAQPPATAAPPAAQAAPAAPPGQ